MKRFIAMLLVVLTLVAAIPMSAAAAEVNPETGMPFKDVKANHWFYNAVKYTYDKGIFSANNSAGDLFAPNVTMTRGMFVTVLFRLSGADQTAYTGKTVFTDVPENPAGQRQRYSAPPGPVRKNSGERCNSYATSGNV